MISEVVLCLLVLQMPSCDITLTLKKSTQQGAEMHITVWHVYASRWWMNSAHFISWMLHGVMGPLNLAYDLQYVICHLPLYLCVPVFRACVYSLHFIPRVEAKKRKSLQLKVHKLYLSCTVAFVKTFLMINRDSDLKHLPQEPPGTYRDTYRANLQSTAKWSSHLSFNFSKLFPLLLVYVLFFFCVPSLAPLVSYILSLTSSAACQLHWTSWRGLRRLRLMSRPGAAHMSACHGQLITGLVVEGSVLVNRMSLRCCRCGSKWKGTGAL